MNIQRNHSENLDDFLAASAPSPLWPDNHDVSITLYRSLTRHTSMSKSYSVNDDGRIIKVGKSGFVAERGQATRLKYRGAPIEILEQLKTQLELIGAQEALVLAPANTDTDETLVVPEKQLSENPTAIAKNGTFFSAPAGPAIMGLDFDKATWPDIISARVDGYPDQLTGVLAAAFSGFGISCFLSRPSTSAFIQNTETGEQTGRPGEHRYYLVDNGTAVKEFAALLHQRLILAGFGYGKVDKTGNIQICSLIDVAATSDYSRFWYEADAILLDPRLKRNQIRFVSLHRRAGSLLHPDEMPRLTEAEGEKLRGIENAIRTELAVEASRQREIYIRERSETLRAKGAEASRTDEILSLAIDKRVLQGDFGVELNDGTVATVAEILEDRERYDNMPCPDPLEPDYGVSKAMIMLSSGRPHIKSFAHGGRIFELQQDRAAKWFDQEAADTSVHELFALPSVQSDLTQHSQFEKGIEVVNGLIDAKTIPVREFVIEPRLPCGVCYQLVGEPGAGKSQMNLLDALAVATGREDILRGATGSSLERLHISGPVIVYNAEDDLDEMRRRLNAAQTHYRVSPKDMKHEIILWSGLDGTNLILLERDEKRRLVRAPGLAMLRKIILEHRAVLAFLDPQINLATGIDENSNDDMNRLLQEITNLAAETRCCIGVTHHTTKQSRQRAGDMGAGRGAFAQVGKVRSAYTLTNVTGDDDVEKALGLTTSDGLMRLENAKLSYSQKLRPTFYRKKVVNIGNGSSSFCSNPFDGAELSPREQLKLHGDRAPVFEVVDVDGLAARAAEKRNSIKEKDVETIARIVDEVMGAHDQIELSGFWEPIGEKMREANIIAAKGRPAITAKVTCGIAYKNFEFEKNGQFVRLRAEKPSNKETGSWVIYRSFVKGNEVNQ